jgi:hypothetical protein
MRISSAIVLALFVALLTAASGSAANVPPGNGAATQYSQTLPGAGGEEATRGSGGAAGGGGKPAVPGETAAQLEKLGREGEATLQVANSTAQQHSGEGGGHGKEAGGGADGAGGSRGRAGAGGGSSGTDAVLGNAIGTSGGGLGFLKLLILATVALAAGAYALRRRGRHTG